VQQVTYGCATCHCTSNTKTINYSPPSTKSLAPSVKEIYTDYRSFTMTVRISTHSILVFMVGQIIMMSLGLIIIQPQDNLSQNIDVSRREGDKVFSTSTKQQIRQAPPASKLPFKCGMVFFYHVPSTGGATINQWLMEYTSKRNGTATYYTHWSREKGKEEHHASIFAQGGKNVHGGMNEFVTNFTSDEWRVVHCHHSSLHLNASEHLLSQWRSTVESLGCGFVANVMFRDPLGHTLSLFKHVERFQSSRDVWAKHLYTRSERGHWATQLDYFLYNFITRNPVSINIFFQ